MTTLKEIEAERDSRAMQQQLRFAARVISSWPAWKQNILVHSSQPTNSQARSPVNNHKKGGGV